MIWIKLQFTMSVMITLMTNLCSLLNAFQMDLNVRCKTVSLTLEPLTRVTLYLNHMNQCVTRFFQHVLG